MYVKQIVGPVAVHPPHVYVLSIYEPWYSAHRPWRLHWIVYTGKLTRKPTNYTAQIASRRSPKPAKPPLRPLSISLTHSKIEAFQLEQLNREPRTENHTILLRRGTSHTYNPYTVSPSSNRQAFSHIPSQSADTVQLKSFRTRILIVTQSLHRSTHKLSFLRLTAPCWTLLARRLRKATTTFDKSFLCIVSAHRGYPNQH